MSTQLESVQRNGNGLGIPDERATRKDRFSGPCDLSNLDLSEIEVEEDSDEGEELAAITEKAETWLKAHLSKLNDLASIAPEKKTKKMRAQERAIIARRDLYLGQDEPAFLTVMWRIVMVHCLNSIKEESTSEAIDRLNELVQEGLLAENEKGKEQAQALAAWGHWYSVPLRAYMRRDDYANVQEAMRLMVHRVTESSQQSLESRTSNLREETTIEPEDLFNGEKGTALIWVPPGKERNGKYSYSYRGGWILAKCERGHICVETAVGPHEQDILKTREGDVSILVSSLNIERPPRTETLLDPEKSFRLEEDQVPLFRKLWGTLKRTKNALEQAEEIRDLEQDLGRETSLDETEFFMQHRVGTTIAKYDCAWWPMEEDADPIEDVIFCIERKVIAEKSTIQIVNLPEHLEDFLGECCEEYPEEERFADCPQPLRAVLMAIFRQVSVRSSLPKD